MWNVTVLLQYLNKKQNYGELNYEAREGKTPKNSYPMMQVTQHKRLWVCSAQMARARGPALLLGVIRAGHCRVAANCLCSCVQLPSECARQRSAGVRWHYYHQLAPTSVVCAACVPLPQNDRRWAPPQRLCIVALKMAAAHGRDWRQTLHSFHLPHFHAFSIQRSIGQNVWICV